jgi:hypothetical protein
MGAWLVLSRPMQNVLVRVLHDTFAIAGDVEKSFMWSSLLGVPLSCVVNLSMVFIMVDKWRRKADRESRVLLTLLAWTRIEGGL